MFTRQIPWKVLIPSLIVLAASPAVIQLVRREIRALMTASVVRAAAAAPIPAFTLELREVVRQGSDRSVAGRESLRSIIVQRSDGSRVEQETHYPGTSMEFTNRTIRLSSGMQILAWNSVNLKTTWKDSQLRADGVRTMRAHKRTAAGNCATDAFGNQVAQRAQYVAKGGQVLPALGNLQTFGFAKSNPDEEVQFAPELDCEEVHRFIIFKRDDGGTDSSELTAKAYALGEPASFLFDTSALREVSPITAFQTQYRKIGWPEDKIQQHSAEMKATEEQYMHQ